MTRKPKLRGLHVPRLFIWLMGFIHGRILKTAALDPDSGVICSGYVTGKCRLYNEVSSKRVESLEYELKGVRAEAASLMTEESLLRCRIRDYPAEKKPVTVNERRSESRTRAEKSAAAGRRSEIIRRLVEIDGRIRSCELAAREELDAIAGALQSRFSTYAHGVTLRPVTDKHIPAVSYETSFELYRAAHRRDDDHLAKIIQEVYDGE